MDKNKKFYGNTVNAIFRTIVELHRNCGNEAVEDFVYLLNSANMMTAYHDLREYKCVENIAESINIWLLTDNSNYRIIKDFNTYKLVEIV